MLRHCLRFEAEQIWRLILSNSALLAFPISKFAGLISRHLMSCGKLGLGSLMVMNAWLVRATVSPSGLTWARAHHMASRAGKGRLGWFIEIFYRFCLASTPLEELITEKQPVVGF